MKSLIIEDYKTVKENLKTKKLSREKYLKEGKYTRSNIEDNFGSWTDFKKSMGEPLLVNYNITKKDIAEKAQHLYKKYGKLTAQIMRDEGYSQTLIDSRYGSFSEMMLSLKLNQEKIGRTRMLSDNSLFNILKNIERKHSYVNTSLVLNHSDVSIPTFINRFGTLFQACLLSNVVHMGEDCNKDNKNRLYNIYSKIKSMLGEKVFHTEVRFDWLISPQSNHVMSVDAYFPDNNLLVEYNGPVHYDENYWTYKINHDTLDKQIERDQVKKNLCLRKGYNYFVIDERKLNNLEIDFKNFIK